MPILPVRARHGTARVPTRCGRGSGHGVGEAAVVGGCGAGVPVAGACGVVCSVAVGGCPVDSPAGPLSSVGDGAVVGPGVGVVVGAVVVGPAVGVGSAGRVVAGADVTGACTVDPDVGPTDGSGGRTWR